MNGLHLHRSNRVEELAVALAEQIEREAAGDPFVSSEVAVGSGGMERWLSRELATRFGVVANVRFARPTSLLERALGELVGEREDEGAGFRPAALRFAVLELLPDLVREVPEAASLEPFCGGAARDRKSLGMASALADALDRLFHYRPELVREMRRGELPRSEKTDPAYALMHALLARLEARLGPHHLEARSARAPAGERAAPRGALPPLHVFGISFLPPLYFELLHGLARAREVHLYALVPSAHYYADASDKKRRALHEAEGALDVDLPILSSWGRMSREFFAMLYSRFDHAADEDRLVEPSRDNLLGHVQADLHAYVERPTAGCQLDESVEVHSCFGSLRQVEALRERLLDAFSRDPSLRPWEVAVMTPDVSLYGPLVLSVFSSSRDGLPEIPVEVADVSLVEQAPAADFVKRFLHFAAGRATAASLAELLEHRAAAVGFGLGEDDLPVVRAIVEKTAMRHGVDEDLSASPPASPHHTLVAGLRRLALGALFPDDAPAFAGLAPLPGLDSEHLRVALATLEATELYLEARERFRAGPRPVRAWVDLASELLRAVFPGGERTTSGALEVEQSLRELAEEAGAFGGDLTLDGFAYELGQRTSALGERVWGQRGGVVVSRLSPMRSVPYRVVAVLGLDEAVFPRRERQPSFDLVSKRRQTGDRDAPTEARHLLLEALLAARERLLVFFTGRDARTLEPIPPPVPLEDLLETLSRMTGEGRDALFVRHPLQPFSAAAFLEGGDRAPDEIRARAALSHAAGMARAARSCLAERHDPPGPFAGGHRLEADLPEEIRLSELVRFFKQPARYLVEHRLRVRFPEQAEELEEREPLVLGALEQWALRNETLSILVREGAVDEARHQAMLARGRAEGSALAHELDREALARARREAEALVHAVGDAKLTLELVPVEVHLELAGGRPVKIVGEAHAPIDERLVFASASKSVKEHQKIAALLEAMCLCASVEPHSVRSVSLFCAGKKKPEAYAVPDPAPTLASWVELYARGLREPLPFFPEASGVLFGKLEKGELVAALAASGKYHGESHDSEGASPASRLLFPSDPFFDAEGRPSREAVELARRVFGAISKGGA